ncbi:MAG: hypothetical protein ACON35_06700 [Candidatus Marinamargulisbacteria bacterium]
MAKIIKLFFYILLVVLLVLDFLFLERESSFTKQGFTLDSINSFFAIFAFLGSCFLLLMTKLISNFIQVNEEYYKNDF